MVAAFGIAGVDLFDLGAAEHRRAVIAALKGSEGFLVQLRIGEGREDHAAAGHGIAGFLAVIGFAVLGVVVQRQVIVGDLYLTALPVLPDDQAGVLDAVVPQPGHVDALGRALALHADAAVGRLGAQLGLAGLVVLAAILLLHVGYLVEQIAVIEADGHGAGQVVALELAHCAGEQELAGAGLVVGLALVGQTRRYQQRGQQLAVLKDIHALGQLVDDQGVIQDCLIDGISDAVTFNNAGQISTNLSAPFQTKNEKGENYGMVAYGGAFELKLGYTVADAWFEFGNMYISTCALMPIPITLNE